MDIFTFLVNMGKCCWFGKVMLPPLQDKPSVYKDGSVRKHLFERYRTEKVQNRNPGYREETTGNLLVLWYVPAATGTTKSCCFLRGGGMEDVTVSFPSFSTETEKA